MRSFTPDGANIGTIDGTDTIDGTISYWVLHPFSNGNVDGIGTVDDTGAIAVSCKRTHK